VQEFEFDNAIVVPSLALLRRGPRLVARTAEVCSLSLSLSLSLAVSLSRSLSLSLLSQRWPLICFVFSWPECC
jgi:hypothetical protein